MFWISGDVLSGVSLWLKTFCVIPKAYWMPVLPVILQMLEKQDINLILSSYYFSVPFKQEVHYSFLTLVKM